ncbi:hypothetical protein BGZ65_005639, partial [Modicella reniformis]
MKSVPAQNIAHNTTEHIDPINNADPHEMGFHNPSTAVDPSTSLHADPYHTVAAYQDDTDEIDLSVDLDDSFDMEEQLANLRVKLENDRKAILRLQHHLIVATNSMMDLMQTPPDKIPDQQQYQMTLGLHQAKVQSLQTTIKETKNRARMVIDLLFICLKDIDDDDEPITYPHFCQGDNQRASTYDFMEPVRTKDRTETSHYPSYLSDQKWLHTKLDELRAKELSKHQDHPEIDFEKGEEKNLKSSSDQTFADWTSLDKVSKILLGFDGPDPAIQTIIARRLQQESCNTRAIDAATAAAMSKDAVARARTKEAVSVRIGIEAHHPDITTVNTAEEIPHTLLNNTKSAAVAEKGDTLPNN